MLVAGLICYWSVVTAPPSITLEIPSSTGADTMQATVPSDLAWLDPRHATAYATLALSLEYALGHRETTSLPRSDQRRSHDRTIARMTLLVLAVTIGYGALMEAGQLFRPDRVASLADAASNGVGATAALVLSRPILRSRSSRRLR